MVDDVRLVEPTQHVCLMLDKLETPIESPGKLSPALYAIRREVLSDSKHKAIPFSPDKHYRGRVDMRKVDGTDRMFHVEARAGHHWDKIELLHTGDKTWDDIATLLSYSVTGDIETLPVRRADCAVDSDLSVEWYAKSIRCQWKRWRSEVGEIELLDENRKHIQFMDIGRRRLETMYLGRKPNPLRVYDKTAETVHRYKQAERAHYRAAMELDEAQQMRCQYYSELGFHGKLSDLDKFLPFDVRQQARNLVKRRFPFIEFHNWEGNTQRLWDFTIRTRIERQMSGDVPLLISSVKGLRDNVLAFNPFERVKFAMPDTVIDWDTVPDLTPIEQLAGEMIERKFKEEGWTFDQLYRRLNVSRTGKRTGRAQAKVDKFREYLERAVDAEQKPGVTAEELFEQYRSSIRRQFRIAA